MPLVAIGSIAGFLTTGIRLRRLDSWRSIGTYSIAASLASLALIMVMFGTWTLGIGGLTERVFFAEIMAWYVVVGWRLFNKRGLNRHASGPQDQPRTMSRSSAMSHGESKWGQGDSKALTPRLQSDGHRPNQALHTRDGV
jgi:hypothetical protein